MITQLYFYTIRYIHTHIYIYIHINIVCVCVCDKFCMYVYKWNSQMRRNTPFLKSDAGSTGVTINIIKITSNSKKVIML